MKYLVVLLFFFTINIYAQEDHSEYVYGPVESALEITEQCLDCHYDIGEEILETRHWNWLGSTYKSDGMYIQTGKRSLMNNFCIAVSSNEPRCTSCHISYGYEDESFNFENPYNIDCLICHDQTGTYAKIPDGAGMPEPDVDLVEVAMSVGNASPGIENCGSCHFNGGGGTGVKHGDLDESLLDADYDLDVHMGGLGYTCIDCHTTKLHQISGASHGSMAQGTNHFECTECHSGEIHELDILDKHYESIACETCHIPAFAKAEPTVTYWDWSTAGKDSSAQNEFGKDSYLKKKGSLIWEKDVQPVYRWYNGSADYYQIGDKINPSGTVKLNNPNGDIRDPKAKITPFKLMKGKQPYDTERNVLIVPNLYGKNGFWKTSDWNKAAQIGMKSVGEKYSGNLDFIETEMYWPVNHMVAPAYEAPKCTHCHSEGENKMLDLKALGYTENPIKTRGRNADKKK